MARDETRIPVIIGVGQINDRPSDPSQGLDSLGLMDAALRAADRDAGGGFLARLDSLCVVDQISMPELGDLSQPLANRLGAAPHLCRKTPTASGDGPILLLNEAANAISAGEIEVAAVAGGEALRTAAALRAAKGARVDAARNSSGKSTPSFNHRYGLVAPVDIYPLYENACRAAFGQTLAEAQRESGEIWERMSLIASENPGAWIRKAATAETILEATPDNRMIAFPYTKLMVANSSVNQGAGFIVTSVAKARAHGIAEDRMIYVGRGAAAHEPGNPLKRDRYDRSAGMTVSLRRALDLNGLTVDDLDLVELYSCFPCVPKMAGRTIGWPADKAATVFGGLTFGGGPIGNYMSHAVVSMVERLRWQGRHGLLFANGGFATHSHSIVLSRSSEIGSDSPLDFDFQAEADSVRGQIPPLIEDYAGPGAIETYTVFYQRDGAPRSGVVVGLTAAGERFVATVPAEDAETIAFLTSSDIEPVGSRGEAVSGPEGMILWNRQTV